MNFQRFTCLRVALFGAVMQCPEYVIDGVVKYLKVYANLLIAVIIFFHYGS